MTRIIYILPLFVIGLMAVMFVQLLLKEETRNMTSRPVPQFTLPEFGKEETAALTDKDLAGDITLVNFFASWCLPCAVEMRQLKTLHERNSVKIYGIAVQDKPEDIARFTEKFGNPFVKIGLDETRLAPPLFGMSALPESFILDGKGNIRYHHVGLIRPEDVDEVILPIIAELRKEQGG